MIEWTKNQLACPACLHLATVFRMCELLLPIVLSCSALAEALRQQEKSHPASCYIFIMPEHLQWSLNWFSCCLSPTIPFHPIPNCQMNPSQKTLSLVIFFFSIHRCGFHGLATISTFQKEKKKLKVPELNVILDTQVITVVEFLGVPKAPVTLVCFQQLIMSNKLPRLQT